MTGKTVLAIDQGTTSSRVLSLDAHGRARKVARAEFAQHYLQQDWVEHDVGDGWRDAPTILGQAAAEEHGDPQATSAPTDEGER